MPAHLRPLAHCVSYGCDRPATRELYNGQNAPSGVYCDRHAKAALRKFQRVHEQDNA